MDDYDFLLIDEFPGYNSAGDKTKLQPGTLMRGSKNVFKTLRGTLATRPGLKLRGTVDPTEAGIKSSDEWETNVGTLRPIRVANGKLEVESDLADGSTLVWYELFATGALTTSLAATLTRFVFDTWWDNDEKTDRLIMVRGDSNILHWSGGMAKVLSSTTDTITLDPASGQDTWAELGFATQITGEKKIIIESREFTYTAGEGTGTLTGVSASSGDASTITPGAIAIQSVFIGTSVPVSNYKADFCKTIRNQVWVGSYSSRVVWISADATPAGGTLGFLKYTQTGTLVLGDPDAIVLDNLAKGIGEKDGKVIIFAGDSDLMVITPNDSLPITQDGTQLTGGGPRAVIQKIEKKKLAGLSSALGHEFIGNLDEYLVWLDQKNRFRALGTFANVNALKPVNLSLSVQKELTEDDFTGGHLRVIQDDDAETAYITAPNTGRDWMYQVRNVVNKFGEIETERLWQPPQIRGISRIAIISGQIFGHSNSHPQIYQMWDTDQFSDDHPSGELIPYYCRAFLAYNNHKLPTRYKNFDKVYFEGYMPEGTALDVALYFDYQGSTDTRLLSISDDSDLCEFFIGVVPPSIGDSSLGDNPLGEGIIPEGGDQEMVPKFRAINSVDLVDCFEYAIEVFSNTVDSRWELLRVGTNAKESSNVPTILTK